MQLNKQIKRNEKKKLYIRAICIRCIIEPAISIENQMASSLSPAENPFVLFFLHTKWREGKKHTPILSAMTPKSGEKSSLNNELMWSSHDKWSHRFFSVPNRCDSINKLNECNKNKTKNKLIPKKTKNYELKQRERILKRN